MKRLRSSNIALQTLALWIAFVAASIGTADCDEGTIKYVATSCRAHIASLTDFGAVGDGTTSNTKAFREAVAHLAQFAGFGGGLLYVPAGRWLTGPFNLTSSFTLFLDRDAVILATQDMNEWPVYDPLPSYGKPKNGGLGRRYSSFIGGSNLTDVVITGNNGTIDGQGAVWWHKAREENLTISRPYLIEPLHTKQLFISDVTLRDSPGYNVHPVYSSEIIVKGITILAPVDSPNTDGINPDSCTNVRIEDCFVVSGDDCVAIKSGLDEYGIAVGMPSEHIIVRNLTCISPTSAVVAVGSEMSGGIQDVRIERTTAINSESAVRIKTGVGRGGYVKHIFARGLSLHTMVRYVFWMDGHYESHADGNYDPNAIPVVGGISYSNVFGENVTQMASLVGIEGAPFTDICLSNVTVRLAANAKKLQWNCTYVEGVSKGVTPAPCAALPDEGAGGEPCPYPTDVLPIDEVRFEECSFTVAAQER